MKNLLDAPVEVSTKGMDGFQIIQYFVQNNFDEEINGILTIQDETLISITPDKAFSLLEDEVQVFHEYFEHIKTWDKEFFAIIAAHLIVENIDITNATFKYVNSIAIPSSFSHLVTSNSSKYEFTDGAGKCFSYEEFTMNNTRE